MTVSQRRASSEALEGGLDESQVVEAMTWLRHQLEWEDVLRRLRRRSGLLPVTSGTGTTGPDVRAPAA